MNVLELLEKLGLSEEELRFFEQGYVLRPVFYRNSEKVVVSLRIKEGMPFEMWMRVRTALEDMLHTKVEVHLKSRIKLDAPADVHRYLSYYTKHHNDPILQTIYPKTTDGMVTLVVPADIKEEQQPALDGLSDFLHSVGIEHTYRPYTPPEVKETVQPLPFEPSPSVRFSINKDNCKYLPLAAIAGDAKEVYIEGEIVSIDSRMTKKKREMQIVVIHEGKEAFTFKRFENKQLTAEMLHEIRPGMYVRAYGNISYDSYDKYFTMTAEAVEVIDAPPIRMDEAEEKRIELHAHTNKSEMDGVCKCSDLVKRAFKWGHKAITIMDHMVVQAYPEAQNTHIDLVKGLPLKRDTDFKVIYGIEMNVADDQAQIVFNADERPLKHAVYVVFDLETTGLSSAYDHIIEFGAVKMQNGQEIGRFQQFIKPPISVPPLIERKTNITNAMLADAPTLEEAMPKILSFIGSDILVAHNAAFDYGFMNEAMKKLGKPPLTNPVIDTLPLAWVLFPERKRYALGNIARGFKIQYDEDDAHRADYDAEVLSFVLARMLQEFGDDLDTMTTLDLQNCQTKDIYKKIHAHHVSLLAKDHVGIKAIYELVTLSHTDYLTYSEKGDDKNSAITTAEARIVKSEIVKRHEHLLIGSSCYNSELFEIARNRSQAELEACMAFYDYIEIQPPGNYCRLVDEESTFTAKRLQEVLLNIIETAKRLGKVVVATSDCHYIDPEDKIIRDIYITAQRIGGARHPLYDRSQTKEAPDQHFRTTQEMLDAFSFLPKELAHELVVTNTHVIADQIERLFPLYERLYPPKIEGCEKLLAEEIYRTAHERYGEQLPEIVSERIEKELSNVIKHGYSVQYYIAHLLVKRSRENGYVVGSRGSVGSSFIATMANITEVNPLDPHYLCPKCHHVEFFTHGECSSGFDLPDKICPECGTVMRGDGHSIPFATFLGFEADKVPDIDLNFSGEYQSKAQAQIEEIFGKGYVFAAGTVATASDKTAVGYVKKYCEEKGLTFSKVKMDYLGKCCEGVKRTTGQHPGGIVVCPKENEIHDFTPVQYPANNPNSEWKTTHFAIKDIHDNILKLDILGHVDPTAMRMLRDMSGVDPVTIPMNDQATMSLFSSTEALHLLDPDKPYPDATGAAGLPEFGTKFIRGILEMTRPTTFAELVSLSGLTHGTDVWLNNAKDLIDAKICTLKEVIGCRDDIMVYLIQKGLEPKDAFSIMELVRKGKWKKVSPELVEQMRIHDVPEWYITSCSKIKYMFPKAHAVAYVMMAIRVAWYKVHMPEYYYAVYFSCRCDAYEISTMIAGEEKIEARLRDIEDRLNSQDHAVVNSVTNKEKSLITVFEVAYEMNRRGYYFGNIDIERSHANRFIVDLNDSHRIIPPFTALDSLGEAVGFSIMKAREQMPFLSKEDLQNRTQLTGSHMKMLEELGCLSNLQETNQLSLF